METLLHDLRYGIRILLKSPGFTAITLLSLTLGIGANTTIFTLINALLLRPPSGVEAPSRLMAVWNRLPNGAYLQQCYPDYVYYRDHNQVFSGLSAYSSDPIHVSWSAAGESAIINGQLVSGNYFSVLGVKPALGRAFLPEENRTPGKHPVAVLGHGFWQQRLGSDPNVVGKMLTLNGHSFSVVGVAPAGFTGVETGFAPDFWVPMMMQSQILPGEDRIVNQTGYWIFTVGRLKPAVTALQAQADLSVLASQLAEAHPETKKGWSTAVLPATGVPPEFRIFVVPFTSLLMAVVGLVLLIACANAASLLLARASGRWREMAIRSALGAKRGRLIRQVLTESILLSCLAGGLGLLLVLWAAPLLLALKPRMLSFITLDLPLDWRVLGFTLLVSLLTGLIFGLAPALHSSGFDVVSRLKDGSPGGYHKSRLRNLLVIGQVSVCLVLLISAGLCLRSLLNAHSIDPGFEIQNRLTVSFDLRILGYSQSRGEQFYKELLDHIETLPGVRSSSLANYLPLGFAREGTAVTIEGYQPPPGQQGFPIGMMAVGPGYFRTMGIPLLRGREFGRQDNAKGPGVFIINEAIARRFWPGQDAVGRRLRFASGSYPTFEIVGVVKTGKYRSLREDAEPFIYRPFFQSYRSRAILVVQSVGDPKQMLAAVRHEIRELDPNLPLVQAETLKEYMAVPLFPAQVTAILLGVFAALALLLALVGLYGAVAYSVSQRTQEFGVRMALGAQRADLLRLVIRQGLVLTLVGLAIGLVGAFAVTRVLSSLLYGIRPTDPVTFASVPLLLAGVALLACYIPARRATKVDPMIALRYE